MPRACRSRRIPAERSAIWQVVSDPYHLSRWWPMVSRIEGVRERPRGKGTQWTKVLKTKEGKSVRAQFRCLYSKEPDAYAWEQEVEGSPFEKIMHAAITTVDLEAVQDGTCVTLEIRQRLRGLSRLGGPMMKRATEARLEQALDGLEQALTGGAQRHEDG